MKKISLFLILTGLSFSVFARQSTSSQTQEITGVVMDRLTQETLIGVNVLVLDHEPLIGTSTDEHGNFVLKNVPLGRHDIKFSYLGFETVILRNILVSSGKQTVLNVEMEESVFEGEAIEVVATIQKDKPINDFAKVSVKKFTVEETQRYAGGLDDPGRLVTVFPGVNSTGGVQNNAISIRGNAPKSVQWRLEGIEIPNPNHFAGLSVAGGGGLTLFSAQLLSNSDFFTGAFPAEYGNALSGVFDINFRSGNRNKREHAVQIGINGLEASSGGPLKKNGSATYLFNYRFSALTLLQPLLPVEGRIQYQDLSFKIDVPTQNSGRFEFWGIGGLDLQTMEAKTDSSKWEYAFSDFTENRIDLGVGAVGVSHSITVNNKGYLKSTLALSGNSTEYSEERFDDNLNLNPYLNIDDNTSRLAFKTFLNQGLGKRITTRTGVELQQLYFNFDLAGKPDNSFPYQSLIRQKDQAQLYQVYQQSEFNVSPRLSVLGGLHGQWFSVNDEFVLEPRAAINWQVLPETALNIGYGLHSQIEELDVYFVEPQANFPNKNLKTSKAHHLVASVDHGIGEVHRIKIEGFWQNMFDVPVIADSSFSMLNYVHDFTFTDALVNEGKGENYGIELTLERFMSKGYYYLLTGTFYSNRYKGGDGIWRNGRFDQKIAANVLFGKEFNLREGRNLLGLNVRGSITGGERYSPVLQAASMNAEEVVFDETRSFSQQFDTHYIVDLSITYRTNKENYSTLWALQIKNLLGAKDPRFDYNFKTEEVDLIKEGLVLPLLSWKIEF